MKLLVSRQRIFSAEAMREKNFRQSDGNLFVEKKKLNFFQFFIYFSMA